MRAADGAVEGVRITETDVEIQVIGDVEPVGICGSGLVDVVAELLRVGLLEPSGRLLVEDEAAVIAPALVSRLRRVPNGKGGESATADQQPTATSDEKAAGRHTSTDSAANEPGEAVDDKPATLFDENDKTGKADA